jgi:transposase
MKISKEANEKAEYLKEMLEDMTGKKIMFKTVEAITKPSKEKKKG